MSQQRTQVLRHRGFFVALAVACACVSPTDPGDIGVRVIGTWKYIGRQSSPADAELNGTLAFTTQSGAQVSGVLDVIETDARGVSRRLASPLLGRTIDSTTLDFDVTLGSSTRRHVGKVSRDSLIGTWIDQPLGGGPPTASGTFRSALVK